MAPTPDPVPFDQEAAALVPAGGAAHGQAAPSPPGAGGPGALDARETEAAADALAALVSGTADAKGGLQRLTGTLRRSASAAGGRAVVSGRWASELVIEMAPRIPVRDRPTLLQQFGGLTGPLLADELVKGAGRASAAVGAAAGTLAAAEELLPPSWWLLPVEVAAEVLVVSAIELKLVAELHAAFDRPLPEGRSERTAALVRAWAERRGVTAVTITSTAGMAELVGHTTRNEIVRQVRRRLAKKTGRSLATLAPAMVGAAAGAALNRRATRSLGRDVASSLAGPPPQQR
jgi:outer membrane lipoprotein SlyB